MKSHKPVAYDSYLQLDKILDAQYLESHKHGVSAPDEMLFIIIHQTYELWFKQILHELEIIVDILNKTKIDDNEPSIANIVHRLNRINEIFKVGVSQISILETMTALDFLDFRDLLRPASGFQSFQFKEIEAKLGLKYDHRYGKSYYEKQLKPEYIERLKTIDQQKSVLELLNEWLGRMPFMHRDDFWEDFAGAAPTADGFWHEYLTIYKDGLMPEEQHNATTLERLLFDQEYGNTRNLNNEASRAALFIMLYRGYPLLQQPFQFLYQLQELDAQIGSWRFRHINMVKRVIGSRSGTGGSSGAEYLNKAMQNHYLFNEISELTTFMIERHRIPKLGDKLKKILGFETDFY